MGNLNTFYLLESSDFAFADSNEQAMFISRMETYQFERVDKLKNRMKAYQNTLFTSETILYNII